MLSFPSDGKRWCKGRAGQRNTQLHHCVSTKGVEKFRFRELLDSPLFDEYFFHGRINYERSASMAAATATAAATTTTPAAATTTTAATPATATGLQDRRNSESEGGGRGTRKVKVAEEKRSS